MKLKFSAAAALDRNARISEGMSRLMAFQAGRAADMTPEVVEARKNRSVNRRTASYGSGGAGGASGGFSDIQFATGRPRDPLFYWRQNNLPYDFSQNEELAKVRAFCNTPDAPVWMGDYSFKPIGEIQPGEEVIGWTWTRGPEQLHGRKRLVRTKVLAVARRWAPEVVRVTMKSGRVLKCTPDHMWANARYSPAWKGQANRDGWKQPEFIPAVTKAKNARFTRIIDPTPELSDGKQRRAADWLSGCYDGEGCGERIGQYEGRNDPVRTRIMDYLDVLGLPHTEQKFTISIAHPGRRGGAGAHQDLVNFLNWCDPVRRVSKQIDKRLLNRPGAGYDEVESVEPIGGGWVVSMQTETGNYTAWGFASKNCRLLYQTDPIIGSCVDIFSKFPTMGDHLTCKDKRLEDFYGSLFFDEDHLNYEEFTVDIGREYWTSGEAWCFATFNEDLGIWDDEELLNPDDVKVERSPFLKEPRFFIRLPWTIRQILQTRQPAWEYNRLVQEYPELTAYTAENTFMPVSNILLKQLKFRGDTFNVRGVPLLTRAMRSMLQKEMLNTALDSIADRLYTPLILCKLGASATDLGTSQPWIPTDDDLENFELALDAALAGDFRALIYNFAVEMLPVLGRENMPDLTPDFERIEDSILQVFGLSRTFLMGAQSGQTYAADALNKELVSCSDMTRTPILQGWRGGPVLRTMKQVWEQSAKYRDVREEGPHEVIDLPVDNNALYTLCFKSGMGQWAPVRRMIRHWHEGTMIRLSQKWGEVTVTPNHSVYASNGDLVMPQDNPELLAIRHLNQMQTPDKEEVHLAVPFSRIEGGWARRMHKDGESVSYPGAPRKLTAEQVSEIFAACKQHAGRRVLAARYGVSEAQIKKIADDRLSWDWRAELETGIRRVPAAQRLGRSMLKVDLKGPDLEAFLRFLGAWLAEGHVSDTLGSGKLIGVSNSDRAWLEGLAADARLFTGDSAPWITEMPCAPGRKRMWVLNISSRTLGDWLEANAGKGAAGKRFPDFVFSLAKRYADILLEPMIFGDGAVKASGNWSYFSLSEELTHGLSLLCSLHGLQYTVARDERTGVYALNQCGYYQSQPDEKRMCEEIQYKGWVYDFEMADQEVPNFTIGIGQVVVHNTMLMTKYQKFQARHFKQRAMVVAEAQEHYDYREHGGKRYVIMEEILETDEESGEKRLVEQPKLLVPERQFAVLNLKDQDVTRQFIEALRASGVPISQRTRTRDLDLDLDEEVQRSQDEAVAQITAEQETRKRAYIALRDGGYPIPQDLQMDFAPLAQLEGMPAGASLGGMPIPRLGAEPGPALLALAPSPEDQEMAEQAEQEGGEMAPPEGQDEGEPGNPDDQSQVPDESNDEKQGMPSEAALFRRTARTREQARGRPLPEHEHEEHKTPVFRPDGELQEVREWETHDAPRSYKTPRVVGVRGRLGLQDGDELPGDDANVL